MKNYNVTEIQKLFDECSVNDFKVRAVHNSVIDDCIHITVGLKELLCEYVRNHNFKRLLFKSNHEIYKLTWFLVNVGGEKERIKKVYVLEKRDKIIDVMASYEFQNAENFANDNLTLIIDEIIAEEV